VVVVELELELGVGRVVVNRHGQAAGESSVQYRFVAGSASAVTDFHGVDGTFTWADGDRSERTVDFQVESDVDLEGEEGFYIELFNVTGADVLGLNDRVDISITDSPCSGVIPTTMANNTSLSAPCYQLQGASQFGPVGQLSISPGTVVVATSGSSLTLTGSSTLHAEGTASLPIIIKGITGEAGVWKGLALQSSSALHRLSHTQIRDASNAVDLRSGALALFDNNLLSNNQGAGVILPMADVETLGKQNAFVNTERGIEIIGRDIDANETVFLPAQSTHYVLSNGVIINGTLKLEPGADLRMGADVPVLVLGNGAVNALGTVEKPINISGLEPRQGYWNGIQFASASSPDNQLAYVTVADGGGDPARAGNIIIDGLESHVTMKNCALKRSAGYGIVYDSLSFQVDLTDITFEENRLGEETM